MVGMLRAACLGGVAASSVAEAGIPRWDAAVVADSHISS